MAQQSCCLWNMKGHFQRSRGEWVIFCTCQEILNMTQAWSTSLLCPAPIHLPWGLPPPSPPPRPVSRGWWQGGGGGSAELSSSSSTQCGIKHPSITLGITILADPPHVTPRNTDENVLWMIRCQILFLETNLFSEWRVCKTWLFLPTFCLMWDPGTRSTCVPARLVTQSRLTLRDPMDCSPPGSSVHGILQARILEWVAISYNRGSSQLRDWTQDSPISCIGRRILHHCATLEAVQPVSQFSQLDS